MGDFIEGLLYASVPVACVIYSVVYLVEVFT